MHAHAHTENLSYNLAVHVKSLLPLEVVSAALSHAIMDDSHGLNHLLLDLRAAHDVKLRQEVVSHSNQSVLGPALEPVHGAARNQAWELEGSLPELLSHL